MEWFNLEETAAELHCSSRTVRKMILAGKLKARKGGLGGRTAPWMVSRNALDEYVAYATADTTADLRRARMVLAS